MKNKAVFLDRDGVINFEQGDYTYQINDVKIVEDIADCLKLWSEKGYLLFVVTNQGGIAKGIYNDTDVNQVHNYIADILKNNGVIIQDFVYCPHHPDYNGKCLCRKPDSLLFEKLIAQNNIDVTSSFMFGDQPRDLQAAEKVGIKSFLTESNTSLKKFIPLIP